MRGWVEGMESKLHTSKPHSCNSYFVLAHQRHCLLPRVVTHCLFLCMSSYLLFKYFKLRFICFHSTILEFKQDVAWLRKGLSRDEQSNQSSQSVFITVVVRINSRLLINVKMKMCFRRRYGASYVSSPFEKLWILFIGKARQ